MNILGRMLPFYVDGPHTNAYRQAVTYEKQHRPNDAVQRRRRAQPQELQALDRRLRGRHRQPPGDRDR
jgi:hypothetical protein